MIICKMFENDTTYFSFFVIQISDPIDVLDLIIETKTVQKSLTHKTDMIDDVI